MKFTLYCCVFLVLNKIIVLELKPGYYLFCTFKQTFSSFFNNMTMFVSFRIFLISTVQNVTKPKLELKQIHTYPDCYNLHHMYYFYLTTGPIKKQWDSMTTKRPSGVNLCRTGQNPPSRNVLELRILLWSWQKKSNHQKN